jgi:hypothetical protein
MAANLVNTNKPPPSSDIVDEGFQDPQPSLWDPSNDTPMDDGEDQPTGKKQYPSVCGVYYQSTHLTVHRSIHSFSGSPNVPHFLMNLFAWKGVVANKSPVAAVTMK